MKCKVFHQRGIHLLEEAINKFLAENEVSVIFTQFSTVYAEDQLEHLMFHTLLLFYYPRVEEPDPFAEEEVLVTRQGDNPFEEEEESIIGGNYHPEDNPHEGIDGYHNQISGYSCSNCHDQGCYQCLDAAQLCE